MNLMLIRKQWTPTGVIGELHDDNLNLVAVTLEHAYKATPPSSHPWMPKVPNGTYTCVRGMHQLEKMLVPFETFEITGVPGHSDILFHVGNYDADSSGCVLVGENVSYGMMSFMITNSRATFAKFMALQDSVDSFQLTVGG
jgi:glutaredoxin-related protein